MTRANKTARSARAPRKRRLALAVVLLAGTAVVVAACSSGGSDSGTSGAAGAKASKQPTVAIALIAPVDLLQDNIKAFKAEMKALGFTPKYKEYNAQGQISNVGTIVNQISQLKPDLVYTIGTPIVIAVKQRLPKTPQLFGVMSDPVGAGVVDSLEKPGGVLTGSQSAVPPEKTFDTVTSAIPDLKRVGIIGNPSEPNSVVEIKTLKAEAQKRGIEFVVKSVANTADVAPAIRSFDDVDALLIPGDSTVVSAIATVAQTADGLKIPTFDPYGASLAEQGITVAFGPDYNALGTAVAKQAGKILAGASPGSLPVVGLGTAGIPNELYVNKSSATATGLAITPELEKLTSKVVGR